MPSLPGWSGVLLEPVARPPKYRTEKERLQAIRDQTRARVARWIEKNPRGWTRILKRYRRRKRVIAL